MKMSICESCFYYSRTRYGTVCSFNGSFNPSKAECANFNSKDQAEAGGLKSIELTRLILSIIDALIQLQPELEKIQDEKLRESLTEICLAAGQAKKLITG